MAMETMFTVSKKALMIFDFLNRGYQWIEQRDKHKRWKKYSDGGLRWRPVLTYLPPDECC
jgi:hypothetical protein